MEVQFPAECKGSSTAFQKNILTKIFQNTPNPDTSIITSLKNDRKFRHTYPKYWSQAVETLYAKGSDEGKGLTNDQVVSNCERALDYIHEQFTLPCAGKAVTVKEALADQDQLKNGASFQTKIVKGQAPFAGVQDFDSWAEVNANQKNQKDGTPASLKEQLSVIEAKAEKWKQEQVVEQDTVEKVQQVSVVLKQATKPPLADKVFILLGAGSEMGAFGMLLDLGAHVIAIRTRNPKNWDKMEQTAKGKCGTLYLPFEPTGEDQKDTQRGCDLMAEPLRIRNWLATLLATDANLSQLSDVTCCMLTYLDGEKHVRISVACDFIMRSLELELAKKNQSLRYSFIGTPSISTVVSKEMADSCEANRSNSSWYVRASAGSFPVVELPVQEKTSHALALLHIYSNLQGPNYALAKNIQIWRVLACKLSSYHVGPPTRTASVQHVKTAKYALEGLSAVFPCQSFDAVVSRSMLGLMLVWDMLCSESDRAEAGVVFKKLMCGNIHGGNHRTNCDIETSKFCGAMVLTRGFFS